MIVENDGISGTVLCPPDLEFEKAPRHASACCAQSNVLVKKSEHRVLSELSSAADVPFGGRIEIEISTSPLIIERVDLQS
jgi:hypothetical protein